MVEGPYLSKAVRAQWRPSFLFRCDLSGLRCLTRCQRYPWQWGRCACQKGAIFICQFVCVIYVYVYIRICVVDRSKDVRATFRATCPPCWRGGMWNNARNSPEACERQTFAGWSWGLQSPKHTWRVCSGQSSLIGSNISNGERAQV